MKNIKLLTLLLLITAKPLLAQVQQPFDPSQLKITWEIKERNYKKGAQTLSTITLVNTGTTTIPAKGWSIRLNDGGPHNAGNDKNIMIDRINGDHFSLYAGKDFKQLAPGDSITSDALSTIKNITDYPKGFYLVFDKDPNKGIPLSATIKISLNEDQINKDVAAKIYTQNSIITEVNEKEIPPVFPTPVNYKRTSGSFGISGSVKIINNPAFVAEANYLSAELGKVLVASPTMSLTATDNIIVLQKKPVSSAEGYELRVQPGKIIISAATNAGIFYGIQSLKSLLPPNAWAAKQNFIVLPCMEIVDAPRFEHRAFMMDVARNFQQKAEVLKLIDLLSLYKFNVLHMHLTDDEGWRIEIPGLPELTQTGAKRVHDPTEVAGVLPSYGSGATGTSASNGFFTTQDYIEILKYATARHIKIIPEIETPGHARAAIKSMNARYERLMKEGKKAEAEEYLLRDLNDKSEYRSVQGFSDNVINPAVPSVYRFFEKVTDELIAMYKTAGAPLQTIHFGGDEVPGGVWEKSPAVKELIKQDTSVKNVDEIWHYYFANINAMLKSKGLYLSGWEEIGLKKAVVNNRKTMVLDPRFAGENFHADVWNNLAGNEDLAYKLANAGYKVVLTNVTNMYLDLAYNQSFDEIGQYWGGFVDVNKPFSFIPYNFYKNQTENEQGKSLPAGHFNGKVQLTEMGRSNIVGIQSPLWSEIIISPERFEYLLLPKVLGVAERAWAPDPAWTTEADTAKSTELYNKAWSVFVTRIGKVELPRLDKYAGGFNYRIPTAGFTSENGQVKANVQLPGFKLRYTTDGSEPTVNSKEFTGDITDSENINFKVFNNAGRGGRTVKFIK
ncbi:beta-N-acetylhexosaminidase [Mucilaginibacter limnophilus]|uniref:beta-N-acetylhexosaminidase n=1 Tax=Mucilaginibacter limnophilus TaxID=1932778 RepID=A0A3S2UN09_9SPHI|nr:family 20 glycosylhydrolase [Mucilaginibacter limnophilus]RVU02410.1 beta-N-acetylhexosaminidase [Mucilaginibacter limnophilus]